MELFDLRGCLTDEGLLALTQNGLDELQRLEAAEHLAYCDRCVDRYTALLSAQPLQQPSGSMTGAVMKSLWVRVMRNTLGRAAVAGVAAVLAFTLWGSGTLQKIVESSLALPSRQEQMQPAPSAEQLWQTADNWLDDLLTRTELPAVWQNGTADPTEPTN